MLFENFLRSSGERPGMLDTAVKAFLEMLEHSHSMYGRAGLAIWGLADVAAVRKEIYERDILVNKAERAVRKSIVGHLAAAGDQNEIVSELRRLQKEIDAFFPDVMKAFRESDEVLGGGLLTREREATRACDRVLDLILAAPSLTSLTSRQVVAYTLAARYHKRIAAHLGNIASSP